MKATCKAIPNGVLNRLAKPTSRTDENTKMSIKKHYPDHTNALAWAGLSMKIFPTLKELCKNADKRNKNKNKNVKGRGEEDVVLISALGSHNCGGRKSIVLLKESKNTMS